MSTFVCPSCAARWKIVGDNTPGDVDVLCPNCPPPGQLVAQTFSDVCPPEKRGYQPRRCSCGHPEGSHKSGGQSFPHPLRFGVCLVAGCGCREFVEVPREEKAA